MKTVASAEKLINDYGGLDNLLKEKGKQIKDITLYALDPAVQFQFQRDLETKFGNWLTDLPNTTKKDIYESSRASFEFLTIFENPKAIIKATGKVVKNNIDDIAAKISKKIAKEETVSVVSVAGEIKLKNKITNEIIADSKNAAKGVIENISNRKWVSKSIDPISDKKLVDRVKELRQKLTSRIKKSGNFGHADVNVSGVTKKEFYAHSGVNELTGDLPNRVPDISLKPKKSEEIFPFSKELSKDGTLIERNVDSEYKILNEIATKLGTNPNATGSIKLFTERPPCPSCSNVITLFKERYPKIDISVKHNNGTQLIN